MPAPSPKYVRFRPVREEQVDDLLLLIDDEEKAIHALPSVSAAVWAYLEEPASISEIKQLMREVFRDASARRIAGDVEALFADFQEFNLVRQVPDQ